MIDPSTTSFWIAAGLTLLLLIALAVAEYRRYGLVGRFYFRFLLLFIAMVALLLTYLKPAYKARGAVVTILISGAQAGEEVLDSLLNLYPAAQVLSLQPHEQYTRIEGLSYLARYAATGSPLFVIGEAFPADQLSYLDKYKLSYLPGNGSRGILSLHYTHAASTTDTLIVEGDWTAGNTASKLLLSLGSVGMDSVSAEQGGVSEYSLKTPLHLPGSRVYRLYHISGAGDTLQTYQLPLKVEEAHSYQLALLTAYPEAETKYLKEYLGQQGFKLYYLAQLAPGIEVKEWINLPQEPVRFNERGLGAWDVLLLSASYHAALGSKSQQELEKAVSQQGLGLMMLPDAAASSLEWAGKRLNFSKEEVRDSFLLQGERVPLEYRPLRNIPPGWQVLLEGKGGIAAISRRLGLGKVVVSGIKTSYPLILRGQQLGYERFWAGLFHEVLPFGDEEADWQLPIAASLHLPLQVKLNSRDSLAQLQVLGPDDQPVSLTFWQSTALQPGWHALFWPRQAGWYRAQVSGDTALFRVSEENTSLLQAQQEKTLQKLSRMQKQEATVLAGFKEEPLPRWWFFVLFLTSMGGLWLEKKLKA